MVHVLRHGRDQCLDQSVTENEMKKYPSLKDAFQSFQSHKDWSWYKQDIRDRVIEQKHKI